MSTPSQPLRDAMIRGLCESPLTFEAMMVWRDELINERILLRDLIDLEATYGAENPPPEPKPVEKEEEPEAKAKTRRGDVDEVEAERERQKKEAEEEEDEDDAAAMSMSRSAILREWLIVSPVTCMCPSPPNRHGTRLVSGSARC